ncbi:MAG: hypothetical protein ACREP2_13825 [Rhodanobacteraceae bacterium]
MNTETLRNLVTSFENDQACLETTAGIEVNPARRVWAEQRAAMIGIIVGRIRGEIMSRETPDARPVGAAQRFESCLEHTLEEYLDVR